MPRSVPATLKSMSPSASCIPGMSLRMAARSLPSSLIRPMGMPATGALRGTPASSSAMVEPHTLAIEVEPLLLRISVTMRVTYGHSSSSGMTLCTARSTSAPWPISRRPGERSGRASPTENGGKL